MIRKIIAPLIFVSIFFTCLELSAQRKETVTVTKHNGEAVQLTTFLRASKDGFIFPDDDKDFIKGKVYGEKTEIPKSDIKKIKLLNGKEYIVLKSTKKRFERKASFNYHIGFYISHGKVSVFKSYAYGRVNEMGEVYIDGRWQPAPPSVNKVARTTYYQVSVGGQFPRVEDTPWWGALDFLKANCAKFRTYVDQQKPIIRERKFEKAVKYYKEICE